MEDKIMYKSYAEEDVDEMIALLDALDEATEGKHPEVKKIRHKLTFPIGGGTLGPIRR